MLYPFEFSEHSEDERIYNKYPNLKINNSPAFYLILRGLTGTLRLKQTFRDITFDQKIDFLKVDSNVSSNEINPEKKETVPELKSGIQNIIALLKTKCNPDIDIIPKYISDTFTLEDLSEVLSDRALVHRNKGFFESLNNEFCNFYYHTHRENHTVAFLHLYRILEYVSYSFPLMYAASTKDFSKSFDALKNLFIGDKDQGELKVFKYFITNVMSAEKDYERLTIDIYITADLNEYRERIYNTILRICDKAIFEESKNLASSKLCVKFSEFSSFIITLRNRFFHLKNSQDTNINSIDIVDSDYFFSLINNKCAYFLSLVTFLIIKKSYFQK